MSSAATRPIGVFDSGIGGLTVLRALLAELPDECFAYLGDTARLPYGTKAAETVVRYGVQAADALMDYGVKCIVVACNTAASVGLESIRERVYPLPVVGVIEPGAEAACRATRTGHIAVIATERTVSGGAYERAILERLPHARVSVLSAQLLVALAEEGLTEGPIPEAISQHYLHDLFGAARAHGAGPRESSGAQAPDTLVLGCTHFPALIEPLARVVGPQVQIVDSAATTARALRSELAARSLASPRAASSVRFLATDGAERFARVGSRFLGRPIAAQEVELIDL